MNTPSMAASHGRMVLPESFLLPRKNAGRAVGRRICVFLALTLGFLASAPAARFDPSKLGTEAKARYDLVKRLYVEERTLASDPEFSKYINHQKCPKATYLFIQRNINIAAYYAQRLIIPAGIYYVDGDGFDVPDGSCIEWEIGAWIYPKKQSPAGSWFTNRRKKVSDNPAVYSRKIESMITLINPQIDGSGIPFDSNYIGDNAMGFAGGYDRDKDNKDLGTFGSVHGVHILGGHVRNFLASFVPKGPGGKAIGFEEGVSSCVVDGLYAKNCTYVTFVSPTSSDDNKYTSDIIFKNITAEKCGALFYYIGDNATSTTATPPPIKTSVSSVFFRGSGTSIGHFPDRLKAGNHEKSAPIVINAGSNIDLVARIVNPPGFPSPSSPGGGTQFPDRYPDIMNPADRDRVGAGLSGPIGAAFWGWGVKCRIAVNYTGECDDSVRIQRCRAHGADFYPQYSGYSKPVGAHDLEVIVTQTGPSGTPLRFGQVGLSGMLRGPFMTTRTACLPYTASVRDQEYTGLIMAVYPQPNMELQRMVIDYKGTFQGLDRLAIVDPGWNLPPTDTFFKLGSTHAANPGQVKGSITVNGMRSFNATYLHDAVNRIYPQYQANGLTLSY